MTTLLIIAGGALLGAGVDAGVQLYHNDWQFDELNWRSIGASAASGAVTSGLMAVPGGASLGLGATITWGAAVSGLGYETYHLVNGSEGDYLELASAMALGGLASGAGYKSNQHFLNRPSWMNTGKVTKTLYSNNEIAAQEIGRYYGKNIVKLEKGYSITLPFGKKSSVVIRIMNAGSGNRSQPYFRIVVPNKGALSLNGTIESNASLTHFDMSEDYLEQITRAISIYTGGFYD